MYVYAYGMGRFVYICMYTHTGWGGLYTYVCIRIRDGEVCIHMYVDAYGMGRFVYICMYICTIYVTMCYTTTLRQFASRAPNFQEFIYDTKSRNSTNNQIILRSYYIQCYVNSYIHYSNCQYYVTISRVGFQEVIKISTGSTKYQGIDGYFYNNVVCLEIVLTVTYV